MSFHACRQSGSLNKDQTDKSDDEMMKEKGDHDLIILHLHKNKRLKYMYADLIQM